MLITKIETSEDYDQALEAVENMLSNPLLKDNDPTFLALLEAIKQYEDEHLPPIPSEPIPGRDILKSLMDYNNLKQVDLVPIFGTSSLVSQVLSGKRSISLDKAKKLGERFCLEPTAFLDI